VKVSSKQKAVSSKVTEFIRGRVLVVLCVLPTVLLLTVSSQAQQPKKVPRVGFLVAGSASVVSARVEAFRQGLRERGYVQIYRR